MKIPDGEVPESGQPLEIGERFSAPFGLLDRLKRPAGGIDFVPVLDLLVIALLLSLLFTRFVMVPGVRVDLPSTDLRMRHSTAPVSVLTTGNRGMLFFNGGVYETSTIERAFRGYIEQTPEAGAVLLIKAEAKMELRLFLDLCRMAQQAGFAQVQIAGEKVEGAPALIPAGGMERGGDMMRPIMR